MPGITGLIGIGGAEASRLATRMVGCIAREPFHKSGVYCNGAWAVSTGWVCDRESFANVQPIWNETRDNCLVFSGEEFTDQAQINGVATRGHESNGENASYLLHLYEELGSGMFEKLNGSFSGFLIDLRRGRAVLFNDRYGLNRIYYHESTEGFYFSSEAKSILHVLPQLRKLDPRSLGEFFSCGCVLQNRSLFPGISVLPGASAWTFYRDGRVSKNSYFRKESWEDQPPLSGEAYYEALKETFVRILPRYLEGRRRVAASLTGGVDGRVIMAWSGKRPGNLPCYTFGGSYRESADVRIARQVARACHQPHQVIPVGEEFLSQFPALAEKTVYITDGAMDVSGAAELYVNRIARKVAPIRITGNYGSEILRDSVGFRPGTVAGDLFEPDLAQHIRAAADTYSAETGGNRRSFIAFKQVPWHHFGRFALEQSQLTVRSPFLDNNLAAIAFRVPVGMETSLVPSLRLIAEGNSALGEIPTDRGITYPAGKTSNKLRRSWAEVLAKAEYAYDYGMPQSLARLDHLLAPLRLERLFLGRQKFCHFRVWYRDRLASYVKEMLLDPRSLSRPYLKRRQLERMVTDHVGGNRSFTTEIHKLLTAELLQRLLIEQQ